MKAVIFTEYGNLNSIKLIEKEIPTPKANQVLIKVKSSSLNAMEWHLFRGVTLVKFKIGWKKPKLKFQTPGADVAGEVISVGTKVTRFKQGDQVFGEMFMGGYAEYAAVDENLLTNKPKNVRFEQAAISPVAGLTALTALKKTCKIKSGDKVLINGASGGVGSYAVMMAKYFGAEVTAVCSKKNFDHVKSLGADQLIDYNTTDFCKQGIKYDAVIEVTGNRTPKEIKAILNPGGKCAVIGFTSAKKMMLYMFSFSRKIKIVNQECNPEILSELADILESGKIEMPITERYKLSEVRDGITKLSTRRTVGKMVVECI